VLERERHQQIPPLGDVPLLALEQSLSDCKPSARLSRLASKRERDAHPERTADCPRDLTAVEVSLMRTLQSPQVIVLPSKHVRGRREQLEIFRTERHRPIGGRQRLVGGPPPPRRVRRAASLQLAEKIRHRSVSRSL
jgi:hypothetical protein